MKLKGIKRLAALAVVAAVLFGIDSYAAESSSAYMPYECYTYWTDTSSEGSRKAVESKPLYKVNQTINVSDMGVSNIASISDIYSRNGKTYLLDSALPSIFVFYKNYKISYKISNLTDENGQSVSFSGSTGIYVTENEDIYICGTEAKKVWISDSSGNIKRVLTLPDSDIIPDNYSFSPIRCAVDSRGYTYVLCDGSYYGALLYSPSGEFISFYGANQVKSSAKQVVSRIWNKLFMNDVKKSASVRALPFQFTDLDIGTNNFIYTATGGTGSDSSGSVKILNPGGLNVMDTSLSNFGDIDSVKTGENKWVLQDLSELAADGDFIYILDKGHGKIFLYDINANLLGVFGGGFTKGTQVGVSAVPMAITLNGEDVLICDKANKTVTIYEITEYGRLVKEAQSLTLHSKYTEAKPLWEEISRQDQNSQLAYRGLAKAAYREGNSKEAMRLAKIGADRSTYAEAFKTARNEFLKDNFIFLSFLILIVIAGIVVITLILKKKSISLIRSQSLKHMLGTVFHPFASFAEVKDKGKGSVVIGTVLVAVYYASEILKSTKSGFIYNYYDTSSFNSLFVLVKTVGIVLLWTVTNWAVSTLFGGIGRIREIYIVTTYSIMPLIISNLLYVLFTSVMLPTESGFLNMMVFLFYCLMVFIMIAGLIKIHDFSFGRIIGTCALTIIGIAVEIFLLFLVGLLIQQTFGFVVTLIYEMIYR